MNTGSTLVWETLQEEMHPVDTENDNESVYDQDFTLEKQHFPMKSGPVSFWETLWGQRNPIDSENDNESIEQYLVYFRNCDTSKTTSLQGFRNRGTSKSPWSEEWWPRIAQKER